MSPPRISVTAAFSPSGSGVTGARFIQNQLARFGFFARLSGIGIAGLVGRPHPALAA